MVPTESRIQRFCLKRKRVEWLRQPRFKLPRNIAWLAHEGNNRTQEKYLEKLTWLSHYDVANYQVDFHIIRFTALTLVWPKQQVLLERFVALWRQIRIPKARAFVWLEFDWQGTSSNIRETTFRSKLWSSFRYCYSWPQKEASDLTFGTNLGLVQFLPNASSLKKYI